MNLALRNIAAANLTDIGDSARLFALANIAGADAIISCWAVKRTSFFWRPSTAINEGDSDGNPRTAPADVVEARILLGIHFRFADTVARRQGKQAADWAFSHILKPIN
jgi:hypothetical protein